MIINTIIQMRDKTTNAKQNKIKQNLKGESKTNRRIEMKIERE